MRADDGREDPLLFLRKSRHVRVLEQIRAVLVIVRMRDVQADLVQPRGPRQHQLRERLVQLPLAGRLPQEIQRRRFDALGLRRVDVIALLHRAHAALARVFVGEAADQVVQQTLAHRAVRDAHAS